MHTAPRRTPLWARPLATFAGPFIAAAAGWLIATVAVWLTGGLG